MSAYFLAQITIHDHETYKRYLDGADAILAVLFTATFCTFMREFSPLWPDRGGHSGGRGWRSGLVVSGGRGFMTFRPHARASFSLVALIGDNCAPYVG